MGTDILEVNNLSKYFGVKGSSPAKMLSKQVLVKAVDDVSFSVKNGETTAVVGESGCGKTTLMRLLLRLIDPSEGEVYFLSQEVTSLYGTKLNKLRRSMQVVFQDPLSSLNPRMKIKDILSEPIITHTNLSGPEIQDRLKELLEIVGLNPDHLWRRPHEFSGGQCQRIAIARALALNPKLVILDEPTSALDVSVQALILKLLSSLQEEFGLTYLFVTHNLSVAQCMADEIIVMYLGKIIEFGSIEEVFDQPKHPYTKLLLRSIPSPLPEERLSFEGMIEGGIPNPANLPTGCRFHPRCPEKIDICKTEEPEEKVYNYSHRVYCHLA